MFDEFWPSNRVSCNLEYATCLISLLISRMLLDNLAKLFAPAVFVARLNRQWGCYRYHIKQTIRCHGMKAIFACHFTINQSLLRLQERLQGTTYALDLIYILLNGKLHLLRVRAEKPRGLTVVWTLTGNLEMEPLFNLIGLQVIEIVAGLVSDTIFVDKALANCAGFPKSYSRVWFGS